MIFKVVTSKTEPDEIQDRIQWKNREGEWKEATVNTLIKTYEEKEYGEWELYDEDFNGWVCTNCNKPWHLDDGTPQENEMNFCPFCGADMRGESDER